MNDNSAEFLVGSLFSGIGGLELGLERAIPGSRTVWQVEQSAFATKVLEKHWPEATRYGDVCSVDAAELEWVDLICGGFPCQDISIAGTGTGLSGSRSGLWREYVRIIRGVGPRFVVVENVPALTFRGLGSVLGDLADLGYDARWGVLSAQDVGAPHLRRRIFIVGWKRSMGHSYRAQRSRWTEERRERSEEGVQMPTARRGTLANANDSGRQMESQGARRGVGRAETQAQAQIFWERNRSQAPNRGEAMAGGPATCARGETESGLGRAVDGISGGLDFDWPSPRGPTQHPGEHPRTRILERGERQRLEALGNAVMPQCAYVIGQWIRQMV